MPQLLVFDVSGRYGFFRVPNTPGMAVTFSFPPRTAMLGLIGTILGLPRNSYWMREHPLRSALVAVQIINSMVVSGEVREIPKESRTISVRLGDADVVLPSGLVRGGTSEEGPRRVSILVSPKFRAYFRCADTKIMAAVQRALQENSFYTTPYLGHTSMPAEIDFRGMFQYQPMRAGTYQVATVVAVDTCGMHIDEDIMVTPDVPMTLTAERHEQGSEVLYTAGAVDRVASIGYRLVDGQSLTTVTTSQRDCVFKVLSEPPVYITPLPS